MPALQAVQQTFGGGTSDIHTTPFPHATGTRARDGVGNEYIYVDFTSTCYGNQPVLLEHTTDSTAAAGTITARALTTADQGKGKIGISITGVTSDNGGWVQIYGRARMQIGGSGVSPSDAANGPTTLNTSVQTRFCLATSVTTPVTLYWSSDPSTNASMYVDGIHIAYDVSLTDVSVGQQSAGGGVTSAPSFVGNEITVFLNYPQISAGIELGSVS